MRKLKPDELKQVDVERCVQSLLTRDECRDAFLNAARYLKRNGCLAKHSDSALNLIIPIVLAFAAGELDWVKDLWRDDE